MDKWLEYEGFSHVAASGSFTTAAAELGITASAVSKQVRALEERLGVRLLQRTTRRVSLTAEGRGFYERLRNVLSDAVEAEQEVTQLHAELRGPLRIGAPMDFGRAHLAATLAEFAAAHPQLSLDVEFSDRFVDLVEEGFDLVVRIGDLADSSLIARRLAPCRRVLCASPDYLAEHGTPRSPRDLADHAKIAYAYDTERSWQFRGERGHERIAVPIRHRTNNGHMLCALVREGLGIALIPTFLIADDLRERRLEAVLTGSLIGEIGIHAVFPYPKLLSNKVRRLVDFLAEHCGTMPYWDDGLELGRD
jgi:DNA-binding transcriptional LysR family regulator